MNRNQWQEVGTGDKVIASREKKKRKREEKKNNSNLSKDPEMGSGGKFSHGLFFHGPSIPHDKQTHQPPDILAWLLGNPYHFPPT